MFDPLALFKTIKRDFVHKQTVVASDLTALKELTMTRRFTHPKRAQIILIALACCSAAQLHMPSRAAADCPDFGSAAGAYPTSIANAVSGPCTTSDGRAGHNACDPDPNRQGIVCVPTEPLQETGSARPDFLIMTVVYAPPGSQDCKNNSTVSYGDGNKVGTTVGASQSTKSGVSIGVTAKAGGVTGTGVETDVNFGYTSTDNASDQMMVTKSTTSTITASGPCTDGIDHDQDQIWLLLGPDVEIQTSESAGCDGCTDSLSWSLGEGGEIYWVHAGELKGTLPMRSSVSDAFSRYGIGSDEQAQILAADPLAFRDGNASDEPDPARFVRIPMTFPYEAAGGGSSGNRSYQMSTEISDTNSQESSYEYTVGVSLSGSAGFSSFVSATLKVATDWTWTSTNSLSLSDASSTAASVSVGSPSDSYTGPTSIAVYYDTIFKTYAFIPVGS